MEKDRIFAAKQESVPAFEFNEAVASVFSDMLERSVPNYVESITRQAQLAVDFYRENTRIYDLGCSHGNLGILMGKTFGSRDFSMVGVDSSQPMIDKYQQRLEGESFRDKVALVCDRAEKVAMSNASVVVVNLTLQFLDLNLRDALMADIHKALVPGGILLLTEKVVSVHDRVSELQLDYYKRFKRENGYSDSQIDRKRLSLEGVLVPVTARWNEELLHQEGFTSVDCFWRHLNFAGWVAVKS